MTSSDGLDPVFAAGATAHMNEDHADAILAYARAFGGVGWATGASLSRLDANGMDIVVRDGARSASCRVDFPNAPVTAGKLRGVLVDLARDARARLALSSD